MLMLRNRWRYRWRMECFIIIGQGDQSWCQKWLKSDDNLTNWMGKKEDQVLINSFLATERNIRASSLDLLLALEFLWRRRRILYLIISCGKVPTFYLLQFLAPQIASCAVGKFNLLHSSDQSYYEYLPQVAIIFRLPSFSGWFEVESF